MSRFYSNNTGTVAKTTPVDSLDNEISVVPVTQTSEYKENLIKQQSSIPLLTQYDDYILKNVQTLINNYNYTKLQWSSEYYKDKAMILAEYKQAKEGFEKNFKKGNEYEYENAVVPALLYSTIGYHGSKILFKNHFFMKNIIGVVAFATIFEFNAPKTYSKVKEYWVNNVDIGKKEKQEFDTKLAGLETTFKNTVNDLKMNNDVLLQDSIHGLRRKLYELIYQKD